MAAGKALTALDSTTLRFYLVLRIKYIVRRFTMATLVRWDPLREAAALHTELSRFMNGVFEGAGQQTQAWVPTLDVWETEDSVVYAFDLPGLSEDQISIEAEDGSL